MRDPTAPRVGDMVWRIALCRQTDVVANDGNMELRRTAVIWTWCRIKSYYGLPAYMNEPGWAILDPRTRATHAITIRYGHDIDLTSMAWIYEERRKSPPRWYKVLGFSETTNWIVMPCRLIERSEMSQVPKDSLSPQPQRVPL